MIKVILSGLLVALLASACALPESQHGSSATVAPSSTPAARTVASAPTAAAPVDPADPNLDPGVAALKASLHARYPATQFREVAATPSAGIYEVVMGNKVAYTDVTGRYFLFG
ncbi:disulfide isomerase DsbC N-terminal domain-containing protein, partial [Burkholderia gladioli]|uniref:disulfide isomerase DsbC N-terminal domain-containing protein n=1 Tax=Burkholderia gladioli TaxID=28095 RepID=UPI002445C6FB